MEDHGSCEEVCPQLPSDTHSDSTIATDDQCYVEQTKDTTSKEHKQLDSADSDHEQDLEYVVSVHNDNEEALEVSGTNDESLPDRSHETELPSEHDVNEPLRESPVPDDRNLEQFSEVLLDSDSGASNHEVHVPIDEVNDKQCEKRVRFADELGGTRIDEGKGFSWVLCLC